MEKLSDERGFLLTLIQRKQVSEKKGKGSSDQIEVSHSHLNKEESLNPDSLAGSKESKEFEEIEELKKSKRGRQKSKELETKECLAEEREKSEKEEASEEKAEKKRRRRRKNKTLQLDNIEDPGSFLALSHSDKETLTREDFLAQEEIDIFDVKDSLCQEDDEEDIKENTHSARNEFINPLPPSELEQRACLLSKELVEVIESIINSKELNLGQKTFMIRKIAQSFVDSFKRKRYIYIYLNSLLSQIYGKRASKIHNYMYQLYLSKNYTYFRKLRPIDVVRFVRLYFGKKGQGIPFKLVPFLIKEARKIKVSIYSRISYYVKKENYFIDKAQAFEIIKERTAAKSRTVAGSNKPKSNT